MIGYGPESSHFVIELTYNYGVKSYELGNEFGGITIRSKEVLERAKQHSWPTTAALNGTTELASPDGYKFFIVNEPQPVDSGKIEITKYFETISNLLQLCVDPVISTTLHSTSISKTIQYWNEVLNMKVLSKDTKTAVFSYDEKFQLKFNEIGKHQPFKIPTYLLTHLFTNSLIY